MTICTHCGAAQQDGAKFCTECGAPLTNGRAPSPAIMPRTEQYNRQKKPLYRRWWVWVIVIAVAVSAFGRRGRPGPSPLDRSQPAETAAPTAKPVPTAAPTRQPDPKPTAGPTKEPAAARGIRPEVREFLDAYEACMDEYAEFMRKYTDAGPAEMMAMMGDYTRILTRYTEYAEKLDALDESELTDAELAYYLAVTNRVSQKLLAVAAD